MRIIRKNALVTQTGMSISKINRLEKAGEFPKRIKLPGYNYVGWIASEVDIWIEELVAKQRKAPT